MNRLCVAKMLDVASIAACTMLALACDAHLRVMGRVSTEAAAVPGATITLSGYTSRESDQAGSFDIGGMGRGTAVLTVTADGFVAVKKKVHAGDYNCMVVLAPESQPKARSRMECRKLYR